MKLLFFLIIVLTGLTLQIQAQSGWVSQYSGTQNTLYPIEFLNSNVGYVAGFQGVILKTMNGGTNWITMFTRDSVNFYSMDFVDINTGLVSGAEGDIFKTTNGGLNWFMPEQGTGDVFIYMLDQNNGWSTHTFNFNIYIKKTTNCGTAWTTISSIEGSAGNMSWVSASTGWLFVSSQFDSKILKTTNSGINWSMQVITYDPYFFRYLKFFNELNGGAVAVKLYGAGEPKYYKTTNGGNNWQVNTLPYTTNIFTAVYALNFDTAWVSQAILFGMYGFNIMKTTNGGLNWTEQYHTDDAGFIYNFFFVNNNTGWAVGDTGLILKTTTGGEPIGIKPISNNVPGKFALYQNYPNPFNPVTKIKFDIPKSSNAKLVIYDVLGREVTTLVNEQLKPGSYEVDWNAANYSSGIYLYKLITAEFNEIRKMVLIK